MTEINNIEGSVKIYADFIVNEEKVTIKETQIVIDLYGLQVDVTDTVMYYMNKNHKYKSRMVSAITQEILNAEE